MWGVVGVSRAYFYARFYANYRRFAKCQRQKKPVKSIMYKILHIAVFCEKGKNAAISRLFVTLSVNIMVFM